MVQNFGRVLCFLVQTENFVNFNLTIKSLLNLRRGLKTVDHDGKTIERRKIILLLQIVAADFHLLPGKVIKNQIHFDFGILGIFRVGEAGNNLTERLQRQLGIVLVLAAESLVFVSNILGKTACFL